MEKATFFFSGPGWCGPNVSTFSSEWDDSVNSFLTSPDVIKPPPQFQDPEEPGQPSPSVKRREKGGKKNDNRIRPASNIELHRRSLSLSTNASSNPGFSRRRCESYALSYPSSSSEDSGSENNSARRGERLPDAVPRSRSRSIILRKAKSKPVPPVRTVSLQRLAAAKHSEEKNIRKDSQSNVTLPDLIPTSKQEAAKSKKPEAPGKVAVKALASNHKALNELRSSEPTSVGMPVNGCGNPEMNTSPSSTQSSPSQLSISSPSKPIGTNSPSSGYGSQCETPTQSALCSVSLVPSIPLGTRMRQKPPPVFPGQRMRNRNARLSLQLPELQQQAPDQEPSSFLSTTNRRNSDSTEATRPKQRMSTSLLMMPMVTQEELNNVHLRSVSSSDLENAQEFSTNIIEEEVEKLSSPQINQKPKPPVAPKPERNKWPSNALAQANVAGPKQPKAKVNERPEDIYAMVNKTKPTHTVPSQYVTGIEQVPQQRPQLFLDGRSPNKKSHQQRFPCTSEFLNVKKPPPNKIQLQKKRRAPTPPLKRTQAVDDSFYSDSAAMKSPIDSESQTNLVISPKSPTAASQYHVTLYGVIPDLPLVTDQHHSRASDHPSFTVDQSEHIPDLGALQLVGEEDDVFLYKSKAQTTEDLFTIIHRSKRKLLGTKDSSELKPGYSGVQMISSGTSSRMNPQNDNFMAFLRRSRSARASCGERISATELLRSSKPTNTVTSTTSQFKGSLGHSHAP
ncbi:hypothetical protein DNTS_010090 [Danionella cerebrum]|uniref:NHS-like protein 2 n=1 Tax=Danionella cerebrum TaxID=2873325 RepID=A0A553N3P5_9TELE|nr:hypothetical protein DNTS_010090 [Danionella translucida]